MALFGGGLLFLGFTIYPGIPLIKKWTAPRTAKNPGQPSALPHNPEDARIIADVKNGTGSMINSPAQVGGHPKLAGGMATPDIDHDGMPDAWELSNGLDPQNPADGKADADGDGYTNLEEYLHSLME